MKNVRLVINMMDGKAAEKDEVWIKEEKKKRQCQPTF
jgi:hypothetical protein